MTVVCELDTATQHSLISKNFDTDKIADKACHIRNRANEKAIYSVTRYEAVGSAIAAKVKVSQDAGGCSDRH